MRAMFPDAPEEADSEVTEDGTACHWLAAEIWEGRHHAIDTLAPNGRVLTDEMFEGVDLYHSVLRSWGEAYPVCEKQIPIPSILEGMKGTPDAWAYNPTLKRLYIADLKFGFRFVEVWDNWQLICYASGLIDLLQLNINDPELTVEFVIVQPRSFHRDGPVRKWTVRAADLRAPVSELARAAKEATRYVPNPGCFDCPGRHVCVAYQNAAMRAFEIAYAGDPHELEPAALGSELRLLKDAQRKIEGRVSGLEAQAENLLRKGKTIPGWVLSASFAREGWRDGAEAQVLTLAEKYFKINAAKPVKAVTPAQARKAGLPSDIVAMYAHKPSTGVRLTKQDPYEAKKAFNNV